MNPLFTKSMIDQSMVRKVVTTRNCYNYAGDGSGGQTRFESSIKVAVCKDGCSGLQLVFTNTLSNDESESISLLVNATLECAIVYGGVVYPVTFAGRRSPILEPGTTLIYSDPIGIDLPANTIIEIRTGLIIASGGRIPVGLRSGGSATVKVRSTSATSQIYSASTMTIPSGGSTATNGYVPIAVLGFVSKDTKSFALWGDSIEVGIGATSKVATGLLGWAENGVANAGYGFTNLSRGGDKTGAYSANSCTTRWAVVRHCDYLLANMAVNDVLAGRTAASILANIDALITRCNRIGIKLIYSMCLTSTTSTDSWATVANQTVAAGFEIGGVRDQVNAGILSRYNEGKIFGLINFSSLLIDPTTNKWLVGKTDDGTHPNDVTHDAMGVVLTDYINSI